MLSQAQRDVDDGIIYRYIAAHGPISGRVLRPLLEKVLSPLETEVEGRIDRSLRRLRKAGRISRSFTGRWRVRKEEGGQA